MNNVFSMSKKQTSKLFSGKSPSTSNPSTVPSTSPSNSPSISSPSTIPSASPSKSPSNLPSKKLFRVQDFHIVI